MKRYALYDEATGQIIKWGFCPNRDFDKIANTVAGEKTIELAEFKKDLDIEYKMTKDAICGARLEKKEKPVDETDNITILP